MTASWTLRINSWGGGGEEGEIEQSRRVQRESEITTYCFKDSTKKEHFVNSVASWKVELIAKGWSNTEVDHIYQPESVEYDDRELQ